MLAVDFRSNHLCYVDQGRSQYHRKTERHREQVDGSCILQKTTGGCCMPTENGGVCQCGMFAGSLIHQAPVIPSQ
jgi:hypothetical protein